MTGSRFPDTPAPSGHQSSRRWPLYRSWPAASSPVPWGYPQLPKARSTSTTTTAAGRVTKVAVERRHVLGIARGALAEIAVITVCHCVFLRLKCVLLHLRSFYRKSYPINIPFSIFLLSYSSPMPAVAVMPVLYSTSRTMVIASSWALMW